MSDYFSHYHYRSNLKTKISEKDLISSFLSIQPSISYPFFGSIKISTLPFEPFTCHFLTAQQHLHDKLNQTAEESPIGP